MTRLEAAFSLIDDCEVFADIGCDHGKLCKEVLDSGKAKKVIAADISKDSLKKARLLLSDYSDVEFRLCDGLDGGKLVADTIAICGLGGLTMIDILRDLPQSTLVLGAQDHLYELRSFLSENGYVIEKDFVIKDGKRFYDFIRAKRGKIEFDRRQLEYGVFCYTKQPVLKEKLEFLLRKISAYPPTKDNINKINTITELLTWQR